MYHILKSRLFQDFLDDNLPGSTINHLYQHVFQKFVFPIPGLDEQRQIAEYLDFIVAAIDQTSTIISKEVCIKTGLMRELLTKGIDEHGQLRSEATHPFVDTPLGRLPASWKTASVEELLAEVDPAMRSGPFGSALLKSELVEEGVPLLGIDNVLSEEFVPTFTRFVSARKAKKLERYRVRPNDVMITIMGTVGRSCVVPCNIGQVLSSKHVWTLSFNEDVCSPLLASYQFNHAPWVKSHFLREEQGGVMSAIRSDTLRSTLFPVPPPEEMRLIEGVLVKLNCSLAKKSAEFRKLQGLRAGLLRDLLSGKVRVPVARGEEQQPVQAVA